MRDSHILLVQPSQGLGLASKVAEDVEWVVVAEAGDLVPGALQALGIELASTRHQVVYADARTRGGRTVQRPEPSPERLRNQYFWGRLVAYRAEIFRDLFPARLSEGAELFELALKATALGARIGRLPLALTWDRDFPHLGDEALTATRAVLAAHLSATGGGRVVSVGADGVHDTRRDVQGEPLVSIIIPSRGTVIEGEGESSHLVNAVNSIVSLSTYRRFEIVVVLDEVAERSVVDRVVELAGSRLRIVWWRRPFNFSEKVNAGVVVAQGEYVLLLNDDILVLTDDWIESMLALAQRPRAGMAGAMLYYEDDTIQHAGHHYFEQDVSHIGLDARRGQGGPASGFRVEREVAGVTAACALMPREIYLEVGGMSNLLPGSFNDVDLCMKVTGAGYDIYWTPHAELYHLESRTRDASVHGFEVRLLWQRWGHRLHAPEFWPYPHDRPPRPAFRPTW